MMMISLLDDIGQLIQSELLRRCKNAPSSILERADTIAFESSNSDFVVSLEYLLIDILAKQSTFLMRCSCKQAMICV
jgi:hypothetical protein